MLFKNDFRNLILTIDLGAIAKNYLLLKSRSGQAETAAVVKANAYGLGVNSVSKILSKTGCKTFFVATLEEAVELRKLLPEVSIHVFNGLFPGWPEQMTHYHLVPVLNCLEQIEMWVKHTQELGIMFSADIHIDTGMSRLGLSPKEIKKCIEVYILSKKIKIDLILSHLVNASDLDDQMNEDQLHSFRDYKGLFDPCRFSLAASSGIFLGNQYLFDLVRPGYALYGGNPIPKQPNPMSPVICIQGRIVQTRSIDALQSVGYGPSFRATKPSRIATVAVGYADGYLRSLGNKGKVWIGDHEAPVVGQISMDLVTLDVSNIPAELVRNGTLVDFIGPHQTLDDVARDAGTIGYELLSRLGTRPHLKYIGG